MLHAACRRSTNSFRRKLFGQATGEAAEEVTEQTTEDSVRVHPLSAFRRYWDIIVILLVLYTILVLPFRAAFYLDYYHDLDEHHNLLQQLQVRLALLLSPSLSKQLPLSPIRNIASDSSFFGQMPIIRLCGW